MQDIPKSSKNNKKLADLRKEKHCRCKKLRLMARNLQKSLKITKVTKVIVTNKEQNYENAAKNRYRVPQNIIEIKLSSRIMLLLEK